MHAVPILEATVEIHAPLPHVWELVSDVRRMSEWSPQVTSTRLRGGFDDVGPGAQFTNRNQQGELAWTTHAEIVDWAPGRRMAFRVEENWAIWSFDLEPTAAGVRVTQRREAPDGVSDLSHELTEAFLGGHVSFTQTLRSGMSETLEAIRSAVEVSR
ncbi:MAG: SRPBCC family protein [Nocardioides sp.]